MVDHDLNNVAKIKFRDYFSNLFSCDKSYKRWVKKTRSSIKKEMDLVKFVQRQRMMVTSLMGLLTGRQKGFVDKMSKMLIRESSNWENTSLDDELSNDEE